MPNALNKSISSTVRQWEEVGASLADAFANYLSWSNRLGTSSLLDDNSASDLIVRIDSSLQNLHTTLGQHLIQARVALAKTRNKFASPICYFPEEILSEIFMWVVYGRGDDLGYFTGIQRRVRTIYHHLHNLLGVCTVRRNVGITRQIFWSIIPMVDPDPGYGFPRLHSTELSLRRAGKQGLHLAIFPQDQFQSPSDTRLEILTKHFPRFCTVNIHSDSSEIVFRVLTMLLQHGVPEKVSQLSLRYRDERPDTDRAQNVHDYFNKDQSLVLLQFARLMSSLLALRISNILFDWNITFSTRLVELRVDEIRLAGTPLVELFMKALSSARELRVLKLIKIEAFSNQGSDILPGSHVPLPKLRSLYLEDLHLNVVNLFLASTTPHSYYLTLNLRTRTTTTLIGEFDTEDVTVDDICESLAPFPVNKLILGDDEPIWATRSGLHSLLKSMPSLKALILNFYNLDNELLRALEPPSTSRSSANRDQFPKLETVEFHCVSLLDGGEELKRAVASHPIRNLVLGGSVRHGSDDDYDELPLEEDDDLVQWLKSNVSGFRFLGDVEDAPESTDIGWQLRGL